ncbi:MAG: type II secretion system protein GspM [Sedimentisphaerales bacterium]|nr:type II secretion system protein GspM [Sedimentisphaerales bacterium]
MMRLTSRERWLAGGLAALIAAVAFTAFCVAPAVERINTLNRVLPEKQKTLQDLSAKSREYLTLRAGLDNLEKQSAPGGKEFELPAFLESMTNELGIAKKVAQMKRQMLQLDPKCSEVIVEVKLENVMLKQLVDFLLKTKSSSHFLQVKNLYIEKSRTDPALLDAVIQISTLTIS